MSETKYQTVARLVLDGVSRDEIAARLGITKRRVHAHVNMARLNGALPPFRPQSRYKIENALRQSGIRIGGMPDVFEALTPDVAGWLISQAVEGSTMAEVVASIITDAYFEENPT